MEFSYPLHKSMYLFYYMYFSTIRPLNSHACITLSGGLLEIFVVIENNSNIIIFYQIIDIQSYNTIK